MATEPPERIHNWQHTQLSIARHYGGIKYNGRSYTIAANEPGQPLVRWDVIKREARSKKDLGALAREGER